MADLLQPNRWRVTDANDDPVPGAKALFYDTGTTTPRTVYSDIGGTIPHPSPLVADANGVFAPAFALGGTAVKVVVTTSADVTLYTLDPVVKVPATSSTASAIAFVPTTEVPETDVQAAIEYVRAELPDAGVSDFAKSFLDDADAAAFRTTTGTQAADATLTSLSGLSLVAGDILYATGADTLVRLAKGTAGQVLAMNSGATAPEWAASPLGVGQTWQNVLASRSIGTSYQNTTGKPISVAVQCSGGSTSYIIQVSTDNSTWIDVSRSIQDGSEQRLTGFAIVPNNHYYRIAAGANAPNTWAELR